MKSVRKRDFVKRRTRHKRAANDLISKLQAQLLGTRFALPGDGSRFPRGCCQKQAGALREGLCAATSPVCSSACAIRKAISSRQGGAMIWTPIGNGRKGTGTATTGKPMKEIGCV